MKTFNFYKTYTRNIFKSIKIGDYIKKDRSMLTVLAVDYTFEHQFGFGNYCYKIYTTDHENVYTIYHDDNIYTLDEMFT